MYVQVRYVFATGDRIESEVRRITEAFSHVARITAPYARVASRVVERTSRRSAEKQRRKEAENANAHCFFFFRIVELASWQHFMQILPPGTSGELCQLLALDDPHLPHVVPASVKICVCCEERVTRTARGEPRNEPWLRTSRVRVRVRGVGRTGMCAPRACTHVTHEHT